MSSLDKLRWKLAWMIMSTSSRRRVYSGNRNPYQRDDAWRAALPGNLPAEGEIVFLRSIESDGREVLWTGFWTTDIDRPEQIQWNVTGSALPYPQYWRRAA